MKIVKKQLHEIQAVRSCAATPHTFGGCRIARDSMVNIKYIYYLLLASLRVGIHKASIGVAMLLTPLRVLSTLLTSIKTHIDVYIDVVSYIYTYTHEYKHI